MPNHSQAFEQSNTLTDNQRQALMARWQMVKEQITQVCNAKQQSQSVKLTKSANDIILLAVSKTKSVEMINTLYQAGQQHFGENYLQEAVEKISQLSELTDTSKDNAMPIVWHYIGHIQRNKTRDIAKHFAWVHTIERDIIAKRLNDQRADDLSPLNVLIQINIDDESRKSGCHPSDVMALVERIMAYPKLNLRGLMVIPAKDSTDAFVRTKALFDDIRSGYPQLEQWDTLSMGMSGDMEMAINHGSTMVRVGTAIFGER